MGVRWRIGALGLLLFWVFILYFYMDWGQPEITDSAFHGDRLSWKVPASTSDNKTGIFFALTHPSPEALLVVVSSDGTSLGGLVTVVNSVLKHTRRPVFFCLAVDSEETFAHLQRWFRLSPELRRVNYTARIFPPQRAKSSLPEVCPEAGKRRVIYLDRDVVVQSDLSRLYSVKMVAGQWAVAADECAAPSRRVFPQPAAAIYAGRFKMKDPALIALKIPPQACLFDTGVMVVDLAAWKENRLSDRIKKYQANPSFLVRPDSDISSAALLLVMHDHTAPLDPLWNVRSLGQTRSSIYSPLFASKAHILHWSGHFKPWGRKAPFAHLWDKHYVPDPTNKFKPIRINLKKY